MSFNNFYDYVNAEWIKKTNIEEGKNVYSTFTCIDKQNEGKIEQLIENETEPLFLLYKKNYDIIDDRDDISLINWINKINSYESLSRIIGILNLYGRKTFLNFVVDVDITNSSFNSLHCVPETNFLNDDIIRDYEEYYKKFLYKSLNSLNIKSMYHEIYEFQKKLNQGISVLSEKDKMIGYKIYTWDEFNKLIGVLDLNLIFSSIKNLTKTEPKNLTVMENFYFNKLSEVILTTKLDVIKDYLKFNVLCKYKPNESNELNDIIHEYKLSIGERTGTQEIFKKQEKVRFFLRNFQSLFNYRYLEKYFNEEKEKNILLLIEYIKESIKEIIQKISWISETTRNEMMLKLENMGFKIGGNRGKYNYSNLYEASKNKEKYQIKISKAFYDKEKMFKKLGKQRDKNEWSMSSFSVNAYYSLINNEIVFPAAIFDSPFFSKDKNFVENLGGMGVVIAHEIAHAFFDIGMKFDYKGNQRDWWAPEDLLKYKKISFNLVDQFSSVNILGQSVNGFSTLGENLSDFMAVKCVCNILNKKNIDKDTYKLMFINYAKIWRIKITSKKVKDKLRNDPHSLGRLRTNIILQNIDEFYTVFDIDENHPMFLHPDKRLKILD